MYYKSEFRKRLVRLYDAIDECLLNDNCGDAEHSSPLFSCIWSLLTYLWGHKDIYKKVHNDLPF